MSSCDLEIVLEKPGTTYTIGDKVRGVVGVTVSQACTCTGLTVAAEWYTHGAGNTSSGSSSLEKLFEGEWKAGEKRVHPFEVQIGYGPLPYHGHYLNVDWRIKAAAAISWGFDPVATAELAVVDNPSLPEIFHGPTVLRGPQEAAAARVLIAVVGLVFTFVGVLTGGIFLSIGVASLAYGQVLMGILMTGIGGLMGLIFVAVGLGVSSAAIRPWLAERRLGKPTVRVVPDLLRGGAEFEVGVSITPLKATELTALYAVLHAREKVISGSGTNRSTHTHELSKVRLPLSGPRTLPPGLPVRFDVKGQIPRDPEPSFSSSDNDLEWRIEVHVELARGGEWTSTHALVVRP